MTTETANLPVEQSADIARIAAHQAVIARIESAPALAAMARTSEEAEQIAAGLAAIDLSGLEELSGRAGKARRDAEARIVYIIAEKRSQEAREDWLRAEREEEAVRLRILREAEEAEESGAKRQ